MTRPKLWIALALFALVALAGPACQTTQPVLAQTTTPSPTAAEPTPQARAATTPTAPAPARQTAVAPDSRLATGAAGTTPAAAGSVCNPCMVMRITALGAKFDGEVTARGRENAIEVLGFTYEVKTPRDQATGMSTGRRQYQPIIFTKRIDKATPLLAKALVDGTPLTAAIELYRTNDAGAEERYYTYEFKDVIISGISVFGFDPEVLTSDATRRTFVLPHVLERDGSISAAGLQQEEVTFTFRAITQTNEITKTTVTDTWQVQ